MKIKFSYGRLNIKLLRAMLYTAFTVAIVLRPEFALGKNQCSNFFVANNIDQIRKIIHRHQEIFDQSFIETAGTTYEAYRGQLKLKQGRYVKRAIDIIEKDQIDLYIRAPESARISISKDGFKNQFQTNTSNGVVAPEERSRLEASMLGMTHKEYIKMEDGLKPKYGSMKLKDKFEKGYADNTKDYGEDLYILKKEKLKDRITFFPGDSLSHFSNSLGKGLWHQYFFPWSRFYLAVAYIAKNMELGWPTMRKPQYDKYTFNLQNQEIWGHDYWEIQIFGELNFDAIESFRFEKSPPSGVFLRALRQKNIPIYDARRGRPVPWKK